MKGDIIKNFITYKGFDSNDFSVDLTPNDEQGSLTVKINLNKNYASTIANANNFVDYSITKVFNGFMTTTDYNNRFSLTFKGDDDTDLLDLKNMQASQIETSFTGDKAEGLTLNGVKYKTLNEFIEKVLVKDKGTSIPKDWSSDSNIKSSIYIDNNLGVASFYVNIPKASVQGSSSDLNFMVTYTGFVKGNVNPTEDNLSFVSDKMLKNYLVSKCGMTVEQVKNLTPKTFADWAGQHVDNLITYKTGEYVTKLADKNNGYKLTITPNEIQGTVSVTINFGIMSNKDSLSEYTIQYTI